MQVTCFYRWRCFPSKRMHVTRLYGSQVEQRQKILPYPLQHIAQNISCEMGKFTLHCVALIYIVLLIRVLYCNVCITVHCIVLHCMYCSLECCDFLARFLRWFPGFHCNPTWPVRIILDPRRINSFLRCAVSNVSPNVQERMHNSHKALSS